MRERPRLRARCDREDGCEAWCLFCSDQSQAKVNSRVGTSVVGTHTSSSCLCSFDSEEDQEEEEDTHVDAHTLHHQLSNKHTLLVFALAACVVNVLGLEGKNTSVYEC